MNDQSPFASAWQDYRKRRRWFLGVWFGGFLIVALLASLLSRLSLDDLAFYILGPTWMIGFVIVALRLSLFRCPRCQQRFFCTWWHCARGDMENKLKQQVLDLHADRMSTQYLASNQFRLWEAMFAYLLLERLRTQGLSGTELERATAGSLRLKLLKIAAQVRVSVRRVYVQMSSAFPLQELFALCHRRLMRLAAPAG